MIIRTCLIACTFSLLGVNAAFGGWIDLFSGEDLAGWRVGENPSSFSVQSGLLVVNGLRSHLYYVGPEGNASFTDFQFKAEVMTTPGANSGIYFHTHYQDTGWPSTGYEAQINQSHSDPKRTGGLYDVLDNYEPVAQDNEWFDYEIIVSGTRIVLKVDGQVITDYSEPEGLNRPWRQLGEGTFAIQSHGFPPGNPVYFRNLRINPTPVPEPSTAALCGLAGTLYLLSRRRRN